jgi:hypothetical protein
MDLTEPLWDWEIAVCISWGVPPTRQGLKDAAKMRQEREHGPH